MYNHTATLDEENGTAMMLVFGGYPFQDFSYALDLHEMKWIRIDVPYKRS